MRVQQNSAVRGPAILAFGLLASLPLSLSCSDAGLAPYHPPAPAALDDRLDLRAEICTSPAVDDFFPVKILFIVDTSDSTSVTERGGVRAQAVAQVMTRYAGNPAVKLGLIAFDSAMAIGLLTSAFFTRMGSLPGGGL